MNKIGVELMADGKGLFRVWAPEKENMILHIVHPQDAEIIMEKDDHGYFSAIVKNVAGGTRYFYRPGGKKDFPDPVSHFQTEGVHGPSEVIDHSGYKWKDELWKGQPLKSLIFYEIHIGTFTKEGTFEAVIPLLKEIAATGINALEIMPVAQFPGNRNWGYDGVFPYSVQNTYGGPTGLKKLVDACHSTGISVFLDVVYNHLGPEGNYLGEFGPYFTKKYKVPWGDAINLDDAWCDGVREYYAQNSIHWYLNYHIDGLRLDAIHTIYDSGAVHFWKLTQQTLKEAEQKNGRHFYMIAECDSNNPRDIKPADAGGYGFDALWLDDFHHALYVLLDKEGKSRYEDFGRMEQLAKAYTDGFVHSGEYVRFRKKKHGASSAGIPGDKFVAFNQNHDQIGNRVMGERLSVLVDFERMKLAAAALLLSPYIPLLFMGEEYGEEAPFYYFVSHTDKELIKAVREGRKKEFEAFKWQVEPPDPQAISTFNDSKIDWSKRTSGKHRILLEWNRKLISLRRTVKALGNFSKNDVRVNLFQEKGLLLHRKSEDEKEHLLCFFNFSESDIDFMVPDFAEKWIKILDSKDNEWIFSAKNKIQDLSSPKKLAAKQTFTSCCWSIVVYSNTKVNQ